MNCEAAAGGRPTAHWKSQFHGQSDIGWRRGNQHRFARLANGKRTLFRNRMPYNPGMSLCVGDIAPGCENVAADIGTPQRPELLAPAGDWECARAAVENGADAIYFALEKFNARIRAPNFTVADLPPLMDYLHRRGVRGYACLNTLVFEDELPEAEACLRALLAAGVDGVLVRDVGIPRLVRRLSPDFPLHASTQMTITSAAGVAFARQLGCNRVVMARELSLTEIAKIQAAERAPRGKRGPPRRGWLGVGHLGWSADAFGGFRARRPVRRVFRSMPDQRRVGRALGQPRRMRPSVSPAVRVGGRRPVRAAG